MSEPLAYLITFTCYGSHLHGAEPGSVDREHNVFGNRYVAPDATRLGTAQARMQQMPYSVDADDRRPFWQPSKRSVGAEAGR